jgi:hypothetical protein
MAMDCNSCEPVARLHVKINVSRFQTDALE